MYIASNVDLPIFKHCEHFHLFLQTYKDLLKMNEKEGPSVLNTDGPSSLKYHNSYDSMKISGASITSMTSPPFFSSIANEPFDVRSPIGKSVGSIVICCPF